GVVTQQRFHGMYTVDFFQRTHDLALGLRAPPLFAAGAEPDLGGPLRCLLGFPDVPAGAESLLCDFPDDALLPPFASASKAFFISRLLRTSAFFAAASLGRYASTTGSLLALRRLGREDDAFSFSFSTGAGAGSAALRLRPTGALVVFSDISKSILRSSRSTR